MTLIPMPFKSRKYASDITAVINPVVLPNAMSVPTHLVQRHLYFLRILSLASRILTVIASYSFAKLPLFDLLPNITSNSSPLLLWDAFHFTHIAQEGYVYDYEWDFFPGTPIVMRLAGVIIHCLKNAELRSLAFCKAAPLLLSRLILQLRFTS